MWNCHFYYVSEDCVSFLRNGLQESSVEEILRLKAACERWLENGGNTNHAPLYLYTAPCPTKGKQRLNESGSIYLMRNNRNGYVKIGYSKRPKFRETTLQSEDPDVELLHSWKGSLRDEKELHAQYASKRIRGEWFNLSSDDVLSLINCTPIP